MGMVQSTNFLGILEQMSMMKDTKQMMSVADTLPSRQSRQAIPRGNSILMAYSLNVSNLETSITRARYSTMVILAISEGCMLMPAMEMVLS